MSISQGTWDLHKAGSKDSFRHQQKLKDAFKRQLHDIISQEDIITSEGGKKVKVPIKALDSYRFIYDRKKNKQIGQGDGSTEKGDVIGKEKSSSAPGEQKAGDGDGDTYYDAEIDIDDLIEMMLEDLSLPRLDPKKRNDILTKDIQYDDIRKRGNISRIDKKRSVIENIKRNAKSGEAKVKDINQDDLRFRTWSERDRPITSAVVFALMDVSGSMGTHEKYIARSFFFWMVNFLRHKYENVEVVFIAHTTEANICTEQEFFYRGQSGGTMCSSAYRLALDIIEQRFNPNDYNIFTFHFSDGDTFGDEEECIKLIQRLLLVCNMVGYGQIELGAANPYVGNAIMGAYGALGYYPTATLAGKYVQAFKNEDNFVQATINKKQDVWTVLKKFFSEELD